MLPRNAVYARQAAVTVIKGTIPGYAGASGACGNAEYSDVCQNCLEPTIYPPSGVYPDFTMITGYVSTTRSFGREFLIFPRHSQEPR